MGLLAGPGVASLAKYRTSGIRKGSVCSSRFFRTKQQDSRGLREVDHLQSVPSNRLHSDSKALRPTTENKLAVRPKARRYGLARSLWTDGYDP